MKSSLYHYKSRVLVVVCIVALAGCGHPSEGAQATTVCGTVLWSGEAVIRPIPIGPGEPGPSLHVTLVAHRPGPSIFLVDNGCTRGAEVFISPPRRVVIAARAVARDGSVAGFRLEGNSIGPATVTVSRHGRVLGVLDVTVTAG